MPHPSASGQRVIDELAKVDKTLSVSFDNVGQGCTLDFTAGVVASGFATPAPEPGTYVLMGIGLGAAGWIARRRRVA